MERFVPTPIIVDYILRKILLGLILANLYLLRQASKVYGFNYEASVSDRDTWKWELHKSLPRYHAQIERKN